MRQTIWCTLSFLVCSTKLLMEKKQFNLAKIASAQMLWVNNKNFFRFNRLSSTTARRKCIRFMEGYIGDQSRLSTYFAQVTTARRQNTKECTPRKKDPICNWICRGFKNLSGNKWKNKLQHPCKRKCKMSTIIKLQCSSGK